MPILLFIGLGADADDDIESWYLLYTFLICTNRIKYAFATKAMNVHRVKQTTSNGEWTTTNNVDYNNNKKT